MDRKIIVTADKSKTLLIPSLNETYHSTNGALNESLHVFIETGFNYFKSKKSISIFEMGFGTGLNALTTLNAAIENNISVDYQTLEKYPISPQEIEELNFDHLTQLNSANHFFKLHQADWNQKSEIHPNFQLTKYKGDLTEFNIPFSNVDLIYFDAFSPNIQPNLWTEQVMTVMYNLLNHGGILTTYCAQGQFKRNLKAAGFTIENLPGPTGKREITRAIKSINP